MFFGPGDLGTIEKVGVAPGVWHLRGALGVKANVVLGSWCHPEHFMFFGPSDLGTI